jgi:hypothetical protein
MTGPLVDDRGRLFGRLNLVDAAIGVFVLVLIPLGYMAFLLFRSSKPVIASVDPAPLTYIEDRASGGTQVSGKLKVRGSGLQPVLRATIGDRAAIAFIFESPASADVLFGDLAEGTHDLVLYDGVQEVARAPRAVTIPPRPAASRQARMRVAGTLIDLDEAAARALRVGDRFPSSGASQAELVALGEPAQDLRGMLEPRGRVFAAAEGRWQRQAGFLVNCDLAVPEECRVNGTSLGAANRVMPVPGAPPTLRLRIDEVVPGSDPIQAVARVRFVVHPEFLDLVKVGDIDRGAPAADGRAASVVTIGGRQVVQGETFLDVELRMGIDPAPVGYQYRTSPIAAGTPLTFTTARYVITGTVLTLTVRAPELSKP